MLEDGDVDVIVSSVELDASFASGGTQCFGGFATPLESGRLYYSQMRVTNRAELTTELRASGFYVDTTPPSSGRVRLTPMLPGGFDSQPGFPAHLTGLVIRVTLGLGFADDESGIAEYEVRLFANGTLVDAGVISGAEQTYDTPQLPPIASGTTLQAEVVAVNRALLSSPAAHSTELLFSLSELQLDDPWVANDTGLPFSVPFTKDAALAIGFLPAADAMHPRAVFSYNWGIVDSPCDEEVQPLAVRWVRGPKLRQQWGRGNAIDSASRAAYANIHGLSTSTRSYNDIEANNNRLAIPRGFFARAYSAPLTPGESYCVMVTACSDETEAMPIRCKNATSPLIRLDKTPPTASVRLLPTDSFDVIKGFPLRLRISCGDVESGLSDETHISLGTAEGWTDLLSNLAIPHPKVNASASDDDAFGRQDNATELNLAGNSSGVRGEVKIQREQLAALPEEGRRLFATVTCINGVKLPTQSFSSLVMDVRLQRTSTSTRSPRPSLTSAYFQHLLRIYFQTLPPPLPATCQSGYTCYTYYTYYTYYACYTCYTYYTCYIYYTCYT